MKLKINAMYFSATGTTKKAVCYLAGKISEKLHNRVMMKYIDFTLPEVRKEPVSFSYDEIVIIGVPVYAGRVPNVLLKYLNSIEGNGVLSIPVVVYGNRNYDDALIELKDILESRSFNILASGAFIGEHAFSDILAKNRPDSQDLEIIDGFADKIVFKLANKSHVEKHDVPGQRPYRPYYMPRDKNGRPVDIKKVAPKTNSNCTSCKLCAEVCPMGSISFDGVSNFKGICIKCCACIKKCPNQAKYFDDPDYLHHKEELEINFILRREPEVFL